MESQDMKVKDLIKKGVDPEELIKALKKEIASAQAEIAQEKEDERQEAIEEARENLIWAFDDYAVALGLVEEDSLTDDKFDEMMALLEILEDEILADAEEDDNDSLPVSVSIKKIDTKGKNPDDIIAEFLKSLH